MPFSFRLGHPFSAAGGSQLASPAASRHRLPPRPRLQVALNPYPSRVDLVSFGPDVTGRFSEIIRFVPRSCVIEAGKFTTFNGSYLAGFRVSGHPEHIEHVAEQADRHPLFPKLRRPFVPMDHLKPALSCIRQRVYLGCDDPELGAVLSIAGLLKLNIAFMEFLRVPTPEEGDVLGVEIQIDVPPNKREPFARFVSQLREMVSGNVLVDVWGPYDSRCGTAVARPWWADFRNAPEIL